MAQAITYAQSTSVYMQKSLQACTPSKFIAHPLNMRMKVALRAKEICGAASSAHQHPGITSARRQPAVALQTHILERATCGSMPEGVWCLYP